VKHLLKLLLEGKALTTEQARAAMDGVMKGEATPAQMGAMLAALKLRGETVAELVGFASSLRAHALKAALGVEPLVDTCGTGGDGLGTFNVSTAAAFIAAGAGASVAKHGNRSVSSKCGSADVLEALGVRPEVDVATAKRCLKEAGLCFLYAPAFHPALKHAGPVRRELGVRTVFNLLGPLANPAGAKRQVLGVYDPKLVRPLAEALRLLGAEEAMVVSALDGLDEISLAAPTKVAHLKGGKVRERMVTARELGLPVYAPADFAGGDARVNASIVNDLLMGKPGPARDLAAANAAAALVVGGQAPDLKAGVALANAAIDGDRAWTVLETLRKLTGGRA